MPKIFKGPAGEWINAMKQAFIGQGADANKIIVQDLMHYAGGDSTPSYTSHIKRRNVIDELSTHSMDDRAIISSVLNVFKDKLKTKQEILNISRQLYDTSDIVQTLIDVMIDDGFGSFQNEDEEFKIEYELDPEELKTLGVEYQKQIQNIFDEFVEKFAIKKLIADIIPELIRDGEYAFGILYDKKNKKGIQRIEDNFDVMNLLPFYSNNKLVFVIHQPAPQTDTNNISLQVNDNMKPTAYNPDNIVFFRLNGRKERINMSGLYDANFRELFTKKTNLELPKFVKIALPMYYSAFNILNRLRLLETISMVLDVADLLKPEIVTVNVPDNTPPTEATTIVRNYERKLNDTAGMEGDLSDASTLLNMANRRMVLPAWLDQKGSIQSAQINQAAKGEQAWNGIDKLRNLAALNIGIPPFYINISGQPIEKAQTIKLYSRYTRKLTALQKCISEGLKDFLMIQSTHMGFNISRKNIKIKFKSITSGDNLDDTDVMAAVVNSVGELYETIDKMVSSEHNRYELDDEQFLELFNNLTSRYLNISRILKINKSAKINPDGEPVEGMGGGGLDSDSSFSSGSFDSGGFSDTGSDAGSSYNDFVSGGNDIIPEAEPTQEEI